nr:DUF1292 domain-containing protein [Bacilli bacterium]
MNNLEEQKFTVINNEGEEVECEALFRFESDETHKNYIVYTDNSQDEEGNTRVYASIYTPGQEKTKLEPIETDAEWNKIQQILDVIQEQVRESMEGTENGGQA